MLLIPSIHHTQRWPDNTRDSFKVKGTNTLPVKSPISKNTDLVEVYQKTIQALPPLSRDTFPLIVENDSRIVSRLRKILGLESKEPYLVLNKTVDQWLKQFQNLIGEQFIEAKYIVGSASTYIAGEALLREALDIFIRQLPKKPPEKRTLSNAINKKISNKTFPYSDVDLRIKVSEKYPLQTLKDLIDLIPGCKTIPLIKGKIRGEVLIVKIGEPGKNSIDLTFCTDLDTDYAFNTDDIKLDLKKTDLQKNLIAFESTKPWKWWEGHALRILEDNTTDPFYSMLRLISQISKGRFSLKPTESITFSQWISIINSNLTNKSKNDISILAKQFDKQETDHDRNPLVLLLLRLRTQQLILSQSSESHAALREAAKTEIDPSTPSWLKAIFHVMQENGSDIASVHKLLELIALLALYEGWNKPFEVKLVKHENIWVLRLRLRGTFGKSDLLIRYDVAAANKFLSDKKLPEQLKKMREIIYSLWRDGLSQREMGEDYRKILAETKNFSPPLEPLTPKMIANIKKALFRIEPQEIIKDLAQNPSLAHKEIDWNQDPEILKEIGEIVFNQYTHNAALRHQLCWRVIYKCIDYRGCSQAADLMKTLRKNHEHPTEGYPALFAHVVLKGGNSSNLYNICSPFPEVDNEYWESLAHSTTKPTDLISLMNQMDISAELFLEMAMLVKIKNPQMGEKILCKVIVHDRKRASHWIIKNDKAEFISQEYNQLLCQHIMENKREFDPEWIKNYLFRKKFVLSNNERIALCQYLLSKPLKVQDKARLLETLEIQDDSLHQIVANEYIGQGESWPENYNQVAKVDSVIAIKWHQIIRNPEDPAFVREALREIEERKALKKEETLKEIQTAPKESKDAIREFVLIGILKNWDKKRVDLEVIKWLDQCKIPWDNFMPGAYTSKAILLGLYNDKETPIKIALPFYSRLFRAVKPEEECHATNWVKMVEKGISKAKAKDSTLLTLLETPLMTDCLQIHAKASLPLLKKLISIKEGIHFIVDTLKAADFKMLEDMLEACTKFDDAGASGAKVFVKFYDSKEHKSKENKSKEKFALHLADLAKKNPFAP